MAPDQTSAGPGEADGAAVSVGRQSLTDTQRQILLALCRPCIGENRYATPATNHDIAAEVFLSVDAVKAHLRTLYRKFDVEPLPHNQKRIRLVELVLENRVFEADDLEPPRAAGERPPPGGGPAGPRRQGGRSAPPSRRLLIAAAAVGAVAIAVGALALAGVFSGDSASEGQSEQPLPKAEYIEAASEACTLTPFRRGLIETESLRGATIAERAEIYALVIGDIRGRVGALPPPAEESGALDRFRQGLGRAADLSGAVAAQPPRSAGRMSKLVAELTIAAGLVQAGALGYGLGSTCAGVADVVARSARNAARAL